jgi:hypothetical protein
MNLEDHPVSLSEIRLLEYAKKFNKPFDQRIADHVRNCELCQSHTRLLHATDPVLTGEDEARIKNLIRESSR